MTLDDFNLHCGALPHANHVVQWGGAHVWKVDGKVFAIAGWSQGDDLAVTFKCTPAGFEMLKTQSGLRPAPYLASRGFPWIQRVDASAMDDAALRAYLDQSHRLAAASLPKKRRVELGLPIPLNQR